MSKIKRIYLKTGIGFLVLFIASVVAVTRIQATNNGENMGGIKDIADMHIDILDDVDAYQEGSISFENLMYSINSKMNSFVINLWNSHTYASVLLVDKYGQIISQSGYMLKFMSKTGTENDWIIPLSRFCSDEQLELIYRTFHSQIQGDSIPVKGEVKGYLDNLGQWIPKKLILRSQEDESKSLELDFDVESLTLLKHVYDMDFTDKSSLVSQTFDEANIWIAGPGSNQHTPTKADRKILKECDLMAMKALANSGNCGGGMARDTYIEEDGRFTITFDGETYYSVVTVVQGFPRREAISELKLFYILLLAVMLLLFLMVSRGFVKQYKRQIALETERRKLTMDAAVQLKEPLTVIHNCGKELQEFISEEKRKELLDTIINQTEQMDTTVRELLTSVRGGKGCKNEKG